MPNHVAALRNSTPDQLVYAKAHLMSLALMLVRSCAMACAALPAAAPMLQRPVPRLSQLAAEPLLHPRCEHHPLQPATKRAT